MPLFLSRSGYKHNHSISQHVHVAPSRNRKKNTQKPSTRACLLGKLALLGNLTSWHLLALVGTAWQFGALASWRLRASRSTSFHASRRRQTARIAPSRGPHPVSKSDSACPRTARWRGTSRMSPRGPRTSGGRYDLERREKTSIPVTSYNRYEATARWNLE